MVPVHEHAQQPEQFRRVLYLVDDDQPAQAFEQCPGCAKLLGDDGVLEVEVIGRALGHEGARERGLAHLAGTHQDHAPELIERAGDLRAQPASVDMHAWIVH